MKKILISSSDSDVAITALKNWETDFTGLAKKLKAPTVGKKGGSYFIRCQGTNRNNADTSDTASIIILDGDSRIGDGGEIFSGAPDPKLIHDALKELGWQHLIYSSHSNGATKEDLEAKGINSGGAYDENYHKYRVLIPCQYTPEQLPALLDHVFNELHTNNIMLAPVKENKAWAQAWYFPRVPDQIRLEMFKFYQHDGSKSLPVDEIYQAWQASHTPPPEPQPLPRPNNISKKAGAIDPIKAFNQSFSCAEILERNNYKKSGKRYLRPGSSSKIPSVQFCSQGNRAYSHGGDDLNDGYAHDAFDLHRILECGGDWAKALNWNADITKSNQRNHMASKAVPLVATMATQKADDLHGGTGDTSTYNEILDNDQKYSSVDLLRFIPNDHLLKRFSANIAAAAHLPESTVLLVGMGVFGSIAARRWGVKYPDGEMLPISLYVVGEQPSGTGKSRCIKEYQKPFFRIRHDLIEKVTKDLQRLESKAAKSKEKGDDQENTEKLTDAEKTEMKELAEKLKRLKAPLFISNATPEGLEDTLHSTSGFFAAVSPEQGLFNALLGLSYGNGESNNDIVLNGYDGGHVSSCRVTRNGYNGEVVGGIVCFAQQGSIEKVLDASNGTGLSERFLMLAEPHMLGKRDHTKRVIIDPALRDEYSKACEFIENTLSEPSNFSDLNALLISDAGHTLIAEFQNKIEPHLVDGGRYSHVSLRGAASKINMQVMKIASILHLLSGSTYNPHIDDECIKSAIGISNALLEANLRLCYDKEIIGQKAEYSAIISYMTKKPGLKLEREIINSLRTTQPFKSATGSTSALIKTTLNDMVHQKLLTKLAMDEGKYGYSMAQ